MWVESQYFRVILWSRHFNFAIFVLYREIRDINVSRENFLQ